MRGTWIKGEGTEAKGINFGYGSLFSVIYTDGSGEKHTYATGAVDSYDGTTMTVSWSWVKPASFTAKVAGNKLTVSGLSKLYHKETGAEAADLYAYNGTYTKQP